MIETHIPEIMIDKMIIKMEEVNFRTERTESLTQIQGIKNHSSHHSKAGRITIGERKTIL